MPIRLSMMICPLDDDDAARPANGSQKWDEATAVLAGDALQTLGFELVLNPMTSDHPSVRNALALALAASGAQGWFWGKLWILQQKRQGKPRILDDIVTATGEDMH